MDLLLFALVFLIGFSTSIIGVIVGSSALLRIPLLILLGFPPQVSVATAHVGSTARGSVGLYKYGKEKLVNVRIGSAMLLVGILGSIIGAYILLSISEAILNKVIAVLIFAMIFLIVVQRNAGMRERPMISKKNWAVGMLSFFVLAIYGGFVGGGVGAIQTYLLVSVFGLTFLGSAATRRIPGLASSLTAVSIFAFYGVINWSLGLVLLVSEGMGAWVGASIAIKKGNRFVRTMFIVVAVALAAKLLLV